MKKTKSTALFVGANKISTKIIDDKNDDNRGCFNDEKLGIKVSIFCLIINLCLSNFKLCAGIIGNSYAMVADSIHSFSDVFTTIIVIIGLKISLKKADAGHPYGHDRFECVAALVLSFVLAGTGLIMGYSAVTNLISGAYKKAKVPEIIALIASVVSILTQILMFIITFKYAKKINSGAMKADAWHHLSDSLSSIGSFIGILGAMLGVSILDVIAGGLICLIILKVAVNIFIDSIKKITDTSAPVDLQIKIKDTVSKIDGVKGIDTLRTRLFGNMVYIDIEISCDRNLNLGDAHAIAQNVHDKIESQFKEVKHCLVHINPYKENE